MYQYLSPPPPQLTLLSYRTYSCPESNLGKLNIMIKAYGS